MAESPNNVFLKTKCDANYQIKLNLGVSGETGLQKQGNDIISTPQGELLNKAF